MISVIEIAGVCATLVEALGWLAAEGLALVANDAVSRALLDVAVAALK